MRFEILWMDLKGILVDLRLQDFGPIFFWSIWILLVISSLRGVDRRDEIAHLTYIGTLMAIGMTLILTMPFGVKSSYGPMGRTVVFFIALIVPSLRWMLERKKTHLDRVVEKVLAENNSGKPNK